MHCTTDTFAEPALDLSPNHPTPLYVSLMHHHHRHRHHQNVDFLDFATNPIKNHNWRLLSTLGLIVPHWSKNGFKRKAMHYNWRITRRKRLKWCYFSIHKIYFIRELASPENQLCWHIFPSEDFTSNNFWRHSPSILQFLLFFGCCFISGKILQQKAIQISEIWRECLQWTDSVLDQGLVGCH